MPGFAWGISAKHCITGAKLALQPDSPCAKCYALKGRYRMPNVIAAQERRLNHYKHNPDWVINMVNLVTRKSKVPFFRWFDSGDLQNLKMLQMIDHVAHLTPKIKHWLPTQEREIVKNLAPPYGIAPNLTIRISSPQINGHIQLEGNSSVVLPKIYAKNWAMRVERSTKTRFFCPAPTQNNQCGDCRACWDSDIQTICYLEH